MRVVIEFDDSWDEDSIKNAFEDNDNFAGIISVDVVGCKQCKCKNIGNERE